MGDPVKFIAIVVAIFAGAFISKQVSDEYDWFKFKKDWQCENLLKTGKSAVWELGSGLAAGEKSPNLTSIYKCVSPLNGTTVYLYMQ